MRWGRDIRFSNAECCLITGLKCQGKVCTRKALDANAAKSFLGSVNMFVVELVEKFRDHGSQDNMKYMLALLIMIEGILLGNEGRFKVDRLNVRLIQDSRLFSHYPWGKKWV